MIHQDLFAAIRAGDGGAVQMNAHNMLEQSPPLGATSLIANAMHHRDCSEATELLLEAGANINAKDSMGMTTLACAMARKLVRIPEVLRRHGATP